MTRVVVTTSSHDADTFDVCARVRGGILGVFRYSVLVPRTASKESFMEAAVDLCLYVASQHADTECTVKSSEYATAHRTVRHYAPHAYQAYPARTARPDDEWYGPPAPTARQIAADLLKQIDPVLHAKMSGGKAFYFATAKHTYIWYPSSRNIIWLGPDEPKYCCVHSKDNTVEQNEYDWAITMRTYLLAEEEHWRATANFHSEYFSRGKVEEHATRDIYPASPTDES